MSKPDGKGARKWFSVAKEAIDSTLDMSESCFQSCFLSRTVSIMTPLSLSSDFQFSFKDDWLTPIERKDRREYLTAMEEGEPGPSRGFGRKIS